MKKNLKIRKAKRRQKGRKQEKRLAKREKERRKIANQKLMKINQVIKKTPRKRRRAKR